MMMPSFVFVFFVVVSMSSLSLVRAYPTPERPRQFVQESPVPQCTLTCTDQVAPMAADCLQTFSSCLSASCAPADFTPASSYMTGYCAGEGIVRTIGGVFVTIVPPAVAATSSPAPETQQADPTTVVVTEYVTLEPTASSTESISELLTTTSEPTNTLFSASSASASTTTFSTTLTNPLRTPAAISVYVILIIILFVCIAFYVRHWRRKRQGDFILPTHRSTRGKSFLIDGESFKNRYIPDAIELMEKPRSIDGSSVFDVKLQDGPLPAVPIPTKNSYSTPSPLPNLVAATTYPAGRNYVALPGQGSSSSTSPIDVCSPPGLDGSGSAVSQNFAAGLERARNVLGRTGDGSPVSPSSSSGSSTPSSASSSTSPTNGDVYAALSKAPVPAYSYQPAAPSPLRAQVRPARVYSTIAEEPRTPHPTAPSPSVAAPSIPPLSFSQMHSTVSAAQHGRQNAGSHGRNPRSTENLRQFTFPLRQSLNDTELQITISEPLRDDRPSFDSERSETPSGSMHRGAGGSVSSVKGRIQALVGGMRKERE